MDPELEDLDSVQAQTRDFLLHCLKERGIEVGGTHHYVRETDPLDISSLDDAFDYAFQHAERADGWQDSQLRISGVSVRVFPHKMFRSLVMIQFVAYFEDRRYMAYLNEHNDFHNSIPEAFRTPAQTFDEWRADLKS